MNSKNIYCGADYYFDCGFLGDCGSFELYISILKSLYGRKKVRATNLYDALKFNEK